LRHFNLGPAGLLPHPIYLNDEKTLLNQSWFLLGLGVQKKSFLQHQSQRFITVFEGDAAQDGIFQPWPESSDGDLAFSKEALTGADLWAEATLYNCLLFSDPLAAALQAAGFSGVFRFQPGIVLE
jgi:hypothetical protein